MMSGGNSPSLSELEQRIAIARDNIRQLIEQAAAFSAPRMNIERGPDRAADARA